MRLKPMRRVQFPFFRPLLKREVIAEGAAGELPFALQRKAEKVCRLLEKESKTEENSTIITGFREKVDAVLVMNGYAPASPEALLGAILFFKKRNKTGMDYDLTIDSYSRELRALSKNQK